MSCRPEWSPCRECKREAKCSYPCDRMEDFVRAYWPILTGYLKYKLIEKGRKKC